MRMVSSDYDDHPDSKASHCAANIAKYYNQYNAQKERSLSFRIWGLTSRANGTFILKLNASW